MSKRHWLALAILSLCVAWAGPGPARAQDQPDLQLPDYELPATLAPDAIRVNGVRALYPFFYAIGETFRERYPDVDVQAGFDGGPAARAQFCEEGDALDIAAYTRSPGEGAPPCAVDTVELEIGDAAVALVASADHAPVACLTVGELALIWSPEAEGILTNWNQVREGLPDLPLTAYGPEADRYPFDDFTGWVVGEPGAIRLDYVPGAPREIAEAVAGDPGALAFIDIAAYNMHRARLRLLEIDGGAGCTPLNAETVQRGAYPLARPVMLAIRAGALEREAVRAFLWHLLFQDEALDRLGFQPALLTQANIDALFPPEAAGSPTEG